VIRLVLRQGGTQLGFGLGLGLLIAMGLTRVIGILMFEVTPRDPPVFLLVVLVIAAVGLLASLVPARRATRTHPVVALRSE
jgi:ABC-type antimicrobial peptide transport system permease subunit